MGVFTADAPDVPLTRDAPLVLVFRWTPGAESGEGDYELLPNVRFVESAHEEGASPGSARFRYEFGRLLSSDGPTQPEHCWPMDAYDPLAVRDDDRVVVRLYPAGQRPGSDGVNWTVLFDGFAAAPDFALDGATNAATFEAHATPVRLWDTPLPGALYRDADALYTPGTPTNTHLPMRFNPDGYQNKTPDGLDENMDEDLPYPVFCEPLAKVTAPAGQQEDSSQAMWTVSSAVRYLLAVGNGSEEFVTNPSGTAVDELLDAWEPVDLVGPIDPDDPDTYTAHPIEVPDLTVDGDVLPVALEKLLDPHGFAFRFDLGQDQAGDPTWALAVWRRDVKSPVKAFKMQAAPDGEVTPLDPAATNVAQIRAGRDGQVVNVVEVRSALRRVEACFTLSPLFDINPGDAAVWQLFDFSKTDVKATNASYRNFGFDECGEGHYDFKANGLVEDVASLDPVLGDPDAGVPAYAHRRRKPEARLLSTDERNNPLEPALFVSVNYTGPVPGVWDGTGAWRKLARGWQLLPDRLGVRITDKNPESWRVGEADPPVGSAAVDNDVIRVISCLATPGADPECARFTLMLCCVVTGDRGVDAVADRRDASPTEFEVRRVDDCRDRFLVDVVGASSWYNDEGDDVALRDDTDDAKAHAAARRRVTEMPQTTVTATVRRLTTAYRVGDKVSGVDGRDIDFNQSGAGWEGEAPSYPSVVGVRYQAEPEHQTVLVLGDKRAEPPEPPRQTRKRLEYRRAHGE